jgi:hypothetical protein
VCSAAAAPALLSPVPIAAHGPITRTPDSAAASPSTHRPAATRLCAPLAQRHEQVRVEISQVSDKTRHGATETS